VRALRNKAWLWLLFWAWAAHAADTSERLAEVQRVRAEAERLVQRIASQLGTLGRELRALDEEIAQLQRKLRSERTRLAQTKARLKKVQREQAQAMRRAKQLRGKMLAVARSLWLRGGLDPALGIVGAPAAEAAHRRALAERVIRAQLKVRTRWLAAQRRLQRLKAQLQALEEQQRAQLQRLQKALRELAQRRAEKRRWLAQWKRRMQKAKGKVQRLLREEAALKMLLDEARHGLRREEQSLGVRIERGHLHWPLRGRVVARFGEIEPPLRHPLEGIRIVPDAPDAEVHAVAAGRVLFADWVGSLGWTMLIDHGDGVVSVYGHNGALYRRAGDWVEAGEAIARVGSSGSVLAPQLFFALRVRGKAVDPLRWLAKRQSERRN